VKQDRQAARADPLFRRALWCLTLAVFAVIPLLEDVAPFGDRVLIVARECVLLRRDWRDADRFVGRVSPEKPMVEL
jgi:hypothetical protein